MQLEAEKAQIEDEMIRQRAQLEVWSNVLSVLFVDSFEHLHTSELILISF
jgi:hypothetical protein